MNAKVLFNSVKGFIDPRIVSCIYLVKDERHGSSVQSKLLSQSIYII